jgi:hypothetical protein
MTEQIFPRAIRALHDSDSITVYQAFNAEIAEAAVRHQSFVGPFKRKRMTWIKPSFLWMMYRSGWGSKDNQTHILAIRMTRTGFESALSQATLTIYEPAVYGDASTWYNRMAVSPVRVQWDPEKSLFLHKLPYRSIQIGLGAAVVPDYIDRWILSITDITEDCKDIHRLVLAGRLTEARARLPVETLYPLPADNGKWIGMDVNPIVRA